MPDLGKYAAEVLTAYGVSAALIVVLVALSVSRAAKVRRRLEQAEGRRRG
jgi:heme exporter protein D